MDANRSIGEYVAGIAWRRTVYSWRFGLPERGAVFEYDGRHRRADQDVTDKRGI